MTKRGRSHIIKGYFWKKTLYYHIDKKEFIFGSEIKSILEIIKPNISIDYKSLSHFLWKGYYVDGDTAYSEIKSLLQEKL